MNSGDTMKPTRRIRIGKRDREILDFIAAEGGATPEVLHRQFFSGKKRAAMTSVLRRLLGSQTGWPLITAEPLDDRRVYYRLTLQGTCLVGARPSSAESLGPIAKVQMYATGWFLYVQNPGRRRRLDLSDFREDFGFAPGRLPRRAFFVDETRKEPHLGVILVDHLASPYHTVNKTVRATQKFLRRGWFDQEIRDRRFVVAVLTSSIERKRAIDARLQPTLIDRLATALLRLTPDPRRGIPLKLSVNVVPGMESIMPGLQFTPRLTEAHHVSLR